MLEAHRSHRNDDAAEVVQDFLAQSTEDREVKQDLAVQENCDIAGKGRGQLPCTATSRHDEYTPGSLRGGSTAR